MIPNFSNNSVIRAWPPLTLPFTLDGLDNVTIIAGSEGTKDKCSDLSCVGNMLTNITGKPLDIEPGIACSMEGNFVT